jgi:hypothetical protein
MCKVAENIMYIPLPSSLYRSAHVQFQRLRAFEGTSTKGTPMAIYALLVPYKSMLAFESPETPPTPAFERYIGMFASNVSTEGIGTAQRLSTIVAYRMASLQLKMYVAYMTTHVLRVHF